MLEKIFIHIFLLNVFLFTLRLNIINNLNIKRHILTLSTKISEVTSQLFFIADLSKFAIFFALWNSARKIPFLRS